MSNLLSLTEVVMMHNIFKKQIPLIVLVSLKRNIRIYSFDEDNNNFFRTVFNLHSSNCVPMQNLFYSYFISDKDPYVLESTTLNFEN